MEIFTSTEASGTYNGSNSDGGNQLLEIQEFLKSQEHFYADAFGQLIRRRTYTAYFWNAAVHDILFGHRLL